MPPRERSEQLRWRAAFTVWSAANEDQEPIDASIRGDRVELRQDGRAYDLNLEGFVAYLTGRPQQLKDAKQRALVRKLL
jgi:hypothetical protein